MKTATFNIRGVAPLLMHSARLSDPLEPLTKQLAEITAIPSKKKTLAHHGEMARIEWLGGVYSDTGGRPMIPAENLEALIRGGAKKKRMGKDVEAGLRVDGDALVKYTGPKTIDKLVDDPSFYFRASIKVGQARVMRTRPIFRQWSLKFSVLFDEDIISTADTVRTFLKLASSRVGLGDWRPRYGRFEVLK